MRGTRTGRKSRCGWIAVRVLVSVLVFSLLTWPMVGGVKAAVAGSNTTFSGEATALSVKSPLLPFDPVLGTNEIRLGYTQKYPAGSPAFQDEASFFNADLNQYGVPLTAEVGHASTFGSGNQSRSEASLANFNLVAEGYTISASFLMARGKATCGSASSVSGQSHIADLVINGQHITITGEPNQTIQLPLGTVVINEQSGDSNNINVTALHIVITNVVEVAVASVHADITCGATPDCPGQHAFVTSGGYILNLNGEKAHFAVAGRNLSNWGHILYRDGNVHIKNPYAVVYRTLADLKNDPKSKMFNVPNNLENSKFEGAAILTETDTTGNSGVSVLVIDMGEPGRGVDYFEILGVAAAGGGFLEGGNIQMHGKCQ